MQYWGGKLSAAQLRVAGWVSSFQRSLQGALDLVWGASEDKQEEDTEEEEPCGDVEEKFQRALPTLRNFARRSRKSLSRFSIRSRPPLQKSKESSFVQINNWYTKEDDKDTDVLIDNEPDLQNNQTSGIQSPKLISDDVLEVSSEDPDTTDFPRIIDLPPFPESSTPLLDTSAQRVKAELGKRRNRARPSRSLRAGVSQRQSQNWRTCDSTDGAEEASKQSESDSEEEQPKQKMVRSPPSSSQRVPMFPGLSPAALLSQIKKKTSLGGQEKTEENDAREEEESQIVEEAPSPLQTSRSPRSAAHLAGAARVLPPLPGADESAASCPSWLKELKSKKRMNQHDDEV